MLSEPKFDLNTIRQVRESRSADLEALLNEAGISMEELVQIVGARSVGDLRKIFEDIKEELVDEHPAENELASYLLKNLIASTLKDVDEDAYNEWLSDARYSIENDNEIHIFVSSSFVANQVENRFGSRYLRALQTVAPSLQHIRYVYR